MSSEESTKRPAGTSKPKVNTPGNANTRGPSGRIGATGGGPGIHAIQVNSAREMVKIHTQGRNPPIRGIAKPFQAPISPASTASASPVSSATTSTHSTSTSISVPAKAHTEECKNPQCPHCGQVIIPSPKSSYPIQDKPSITINDWSIFVIKKPILNAVELDNIAETKFSFPLPEMIFGNNSIRLTNEKDGTTIEFNTIDALDGLDDSCDFKVSYHKEWLQSRRNDVTNPSTSSFITEKGASNAATNTLTLSPSSTNSSGTSTNPNTSNAGSAHNSPLPTKDLTRLTDLESLKPYDWTYSTNYKGTIANSNPDFLKRSDSTKIPIDRLMRPDPILFFDEMVLFEDELGDNGISMLTIKIRVMPTCLLLLSRFFLRIDNVAFRVRDTRIFIDLETSHIIREYKEQESSYDDVMRKVTGGSSKVVDPKGLLRDTNWVSQNIPVLKVEVETNIVD